MAYRIDYFRQGEKVGAVPCPMTLDHAKKAALTGLILHKADLAKIMDDSGKEVAKVTR